MNSPPRNAFLMVVRCPANHGILAGMLETDEDVIALGSSEGSPAWRAAQELMTQMMQQMESGELNGHCPACGADFETWKLHVHRTDCTSVEQLQAELDKEQAAAQAGEQGTLFDRSPEAF